MYTLSKVDLQQVDRAHAVVQEVVWRCHEEDGRRGVEVEPQYGGGAQ